MAPVQFPDDENGDALRNMEASGDDLSKSRTVDFSVIFDSLEQAEEFQAQLTRTGIAAEISDETSGDAVDVTVRTEMVPTHAAITEFEALLSRLASPLGGENDGWGSFAVK